MPNWRTKLVALDKGLRTDEAPLALGEPSISEAQNLDFGLKGGVRGRPGWVARGGFSVRALNASGEPLPGAVDRENVTHSNLRAFTVKDPTGEKPALLGQGRAYVHDGTQWNDAGGAGSYVHRRLATFGAGINPCTTFADTNTFLTKEGVATSNFGLAPSNLRGAVLLDSDGRNSVVSRVPATAGFSTALGGQGARCGDTTACIVNEGSIILWLILRQGDSALSLTNVAIAFDARVSSTDANFRNRPIICCDEDSTVFYVAYWTTNVSNREFKVLRVDTSGTILTTATYSMPDGTAGCIWIANSDSTTNRLVVACSGRVGGGIYTKVLNATTLADQAIDVTLEAGQFTSFQQGQVVVGALDTSEAWVAFCAGMAIGDDQSNGGKLFISKRSLSAATSRRYLLRKGWAHNVPTGGIATETGVQFQIAHQPVKIAGGNGTFRTILGLAVIKGVYQRGSGSGSEAPFASTATWFCVDITDLWADGVATGATSGSLRDPVTIARGPLDSSGPFWVPRAAIVGTSALSYRFPSVEFTDVFPSPFVRVDDLAATTRADGLVIATQMGKNGALVLNEIAPSAPQVAHFGSTTIIGGCSPRQIAGGGITPVGWPMADGPCISTDDSVAGGFLAAGFYGVQALWAYTDEMGRVHRSMPSNRLVQTPVGANERFNVRVTMPHFNEREFGGKVVCEVYVTMPNPATNDTAHYLVGTIAYDRTLSEGQLMVSRVSSDSQPIYTLGRVLSNQTPNASGGVATVGDRCWVSDGTTLYPSKLGDEVAGNEAPSWHVDDTLKLLMPVSSGRITGLQGYEDKLVILTDTGIWMTTGVGPNDLGQGPAFQSPLKVSDVGCRLPRESCYTPKGVIFKSADTLADGQFGQATGGLWLLTGGLECQRISGPAEALMTSSDAELCFWPGREMLFISRANSEDTIVLNMRAGQWATWEAAPSFQDYPFSLTVADGIVWGINPFLGNPTNLTGNIGFDDDGTNVWEFMAALTVDNIPIGEDPGGWGRCRSVKVMGQQVVDPYDLTIEMSKDSNSFPGTISIPAVITTDVEGFLAVEKTPYVTIRLTATPATNIWSALALSVKGYARNKNIRREPGS